MSNDYVSVRLLAVHFLSMLGLDLPQTVEFQKVAVSESAILSCVEGLPELVKQLPKALPSEQVTWNKGVVVNMKSHIRTKYKDLTSLDFTHATVDADTLLADAERQFQITPSGFNSLLAPPEPFEITEEIKDKLVHYMRSTKPENPCPGVALVYEKLMSCTRPGEQNGAKMFYSFYKRFIAECNSITVLQNVTDELTLFREKNRISELTKRTHSGKFFVNTSIEDLRNINGVIRVCQNRIKGVDREIAIYVARTHETYLKEKNLKVFCRNKVTSPRARTMSRQDAAAICVEQGIPLLVFEDVFGNHKTQFERIKIQLQFLETLPIGSMVTCFLRRKDCENLSPTQNSYFLKYKNFVTGLTGSPHSGMVYVFKGTENVNPNGLNFFFSMQTASFNNFSRLSLELFGAAPKIKTTLTTQIDQVKFMEGYSSVLMLSKQNNQFDRRTDNKSLLVEQKGLGLVKNLVEIFPAERALVSPKKLEADIEKAITEIKDTFDIKEVEEAAAYDSD